MLDWTKSNDDFSPQYARARAKGYQCMADERGRARASSPVRAAGRPGEIGRPGDYRAVSPLLSRGKQWPPHRQGVRYIFSSNRRRHGDIIVAHAANCTRLAEHRAKGKETMRQLVESWVEAEKTGYGNTLGDAIKALSKECGITLTHSRVAEWRKGKYTPSPKVLSHMLYRVYPWTLQKVGLRASEAQLDAIEDLLWKVNVTGGERNIELL